MADSETLTMVKMIMSLALIVAISTLMPGAPANPGWTALQSTLQTGFPAFNNPFQGQSATVDLTPSPVWFNGVNASAYPPPDSVVGTANGCAIGTWWKCVQDPGGPDGNGSATVGRLITNMSSVAMWSSGLVASGTAVFWCRSTDANTYALSVVIGDPTGPAAIAAVLSTEGYANSCGPGNYTRVSVTLVSSGGTVLYDLATHGDPNLALDIVAVNPDNGNVLSPQHIEITSTRASVFITGATANCGSGSFFTTLGCQVGLAVGFLINLGLFVVNGAIFLGGVIGWGATVVFEFVGSILIAMGWPLTIGAPPIVAALLSVVVFGMYGMIILWLLKLVRGTGSTG